MHEMRRNRFGLKLLTIGLSFALAVPGIASERQSARIYPTGKITIYRGDQKVGEFSKEAPFPTGLLIACDGSCGIKMDNLYLMAEDESLFCVDTVINRRELSVKKGVVYFALSGKSRLGNFITPSGSLAVLQILLNATAGRPQLKGYVAVKQSGSELGIISGGSMIVSTQQGEMIIKSGQRLILAQAELDIGPPEEKEEAAKKEDKEKKPGLSKGAKITMGAIGTLAIAAGVVALAGGGGGGSGGSGGGGGGGSSVSPSSPTP